MIFSRLPLLYYIILFLTLLMPIVALAVIQNDSLSHEKQIVFLEKQVKQHPRSAELHAQLAQAYFDQLMHSRDLDVIVKVEAALADSFSVQPNLKAFVVKARLSNYRHQFVEAKQWANKAKQVTPQDTVVTAILTEALLGLGETHAAEKLLRDSTHEDFNIWASRGQLYAQKHAFDKAAYAFEQAGIAAKQQHTPSRALWALVNQAGMYLDSDRPQQAKPLLEKAQAMDANDFLLQVHWMEYFIAHQQHDKAYRLAVTLLAQQVDPYLEAHAFTLAKSLGKHSQAKQHFERAEAYYLKAIQRDEVFTLGALARLYCDAGLQLKRARQLAHQNMHYKRDPLAHETVQSTEHCALN